MSEIPRWVRKCQECGHIQSAVKPDPEKPMTESYANSKCRRCKSEALDYGQERKSADILREEIKNGE